MNFKYAYVIFLATFSIASYASLPNTGPNSTPGSAPPSVPDSVSGESSGSQKPLEVNGQSRNLNMMLVLRNDKDKIKFVHPRENYRDEIATENATENRIENSSGEPAPMKEGKN